MRLRQIGEDLEKIKFVRLKLYRTKNDVYNYEHFTLKNQSYQSPLEHMLLGK